MSRFKFLDETGAGANMTRRYRRPSKGSEQLALYVIVTLTSQHLLVCLEVINCARDSLCDFGPFQYNCQGVAG